MGKFDMDIQREIERLYPAPCLSFQWETGYIVITQEAFCKLSSRKKDILLAPMLPTKKKGGRKKK